MISKEVRKTINQIKSYDTQTKYMLLSRMEQDCKYFLGAGNGCIKNLWGSNIHDHILYMIALWNSFSPEDKPEWISIEKITSYCHMMWIKEKIKAREQEAAVK